MSGDAKLLRDLLEPSVAALGYDGVHLDVGGGRDRVLRILIDAPGGIRVDDCEAVSRRLTALLEVEDDALRKSCAIEVSSPGLDRLLVKPEHFRRFAGSRAKIVLTAPRDGRRRFSGALMKVSEHGVVIDVDGERYELAYDDMDSARLEPAF